MKAPPLCIGPHESPGAGIRRIAREQMNAACAILRKGGDPVEAVHEARKALKKVRAAFRLVAPQFGRRRREAEKAALREAARLLGPMRDAEVRLNTLAALVQTAPAKADAFATVHAALEADRKRVATHAAITKRRVLAHLDTSRGRLQSWPVQALKMGDLLAVARRTYQKGRRALAAYRAHPGADAFHTWRKRVKELWYQLRMLRNAFRKAEVNQRIKQLNKLGELAGNAHDLDALRATLKTLAGPGIQPRPIVEEIDIRAPGNYRAALKKGERFYKDKPAEFMRALAK